VSTAEPINDRAKPFDPLVLDRTVIALPLLRAIQEDFEGIKAILEARPGWEREYNVAIEYRSDFPGGLESARRRFEEMATVAAQGALDMSKRRLTSASAETRKRLQERDQALEEAVRSQKIGPLMPEKPYGFALLDASVIRRILNENERLASSDPRRPIVLLGPSRFEVIIDLNLEHPAGREAARQWVLDHVEPAKADVNVRDAGQDVHWEKDDPNGQYLFARLEGRAIQRLAELDIAQAEAAAKERRDKTTDASLNAQIDSRKYRAIFHIWPDFEVSACINKSIATVKADAAQNSFSAYGGGITWAVMDSGIYKDHQHFKKYSNVDPDSPLHKDFTLDGAGPFDDANGHGTHVAGIIAGEWRVAPDAPVNQRPIAISRFLKENGDTDIQEIRLEGASGMAPRCQLVSLRVLDENGKGSVSNLIAAIAHVQEKNGYGRRLVIHGVNMSLGYNFEPEWFACGQSPLCVEVNRLVKSGVVVVVAAGNTGYGTLKSSIGATTAGMGLTINDPGNADLAITVGSTHRDMPHVYGVSYFSSKGPTGDGRLKPDLVAPGEKIISCATGMLRAEGAKGHACDYVETSGTSMAAPHVSGVIAAFLSIRGEFIGKAERVKDLFVSSATDLRRDRYFQGSGLVDLMRAIQSV
jgi:subtilisin family serine protease